MQKIEDSGPVVYTHEFNFETFVIANWLSEYFPNVGDKLRELANNSGFAADTWLKEFVESKSPLSNADMYTDLLNASLGDVNYTRLVNMYTSGNLAYKQADLSLPDVKYNGWPNYESWCIALWLDNDYRTQKYLFEFSENRETNDVALHIKFKVLSFKPFVLNAPFGKLLKNALSKANWLEIAKHYREEV